MHRLLCLEVGGVSSNSFAPVMLILADHLEVPSSTLCLICFMWVTCVALTTLNTSWMSSKISGLFLSRIFMRSLRTMIMFWVRSSAPCLELFSAAPGRGGNKKQKLIEWQHGCRLNRHGMEDTRKGLCFLPEWENVAEKVRNGRTEQKNREKLRRKEGDDKCL